MKLSKPQEEAVKTINGQMILISCPGSGKTSTVVRRVQYMVENGVPSQQMLVLTFSRAAATEMKDRFLKLMPKEDRRGENVWFATIHSFCYNIIASAYKLTADNILGETEGWMIIRKGIDELKKKKILKMDIRDYTDFTSSCLREISVINNNGVEWSTYKAQTCPTNEFKAIFELYEEQKRCIGKIDYDDMLKLCYQLLAEREDYLQYYRERFRYIIVDEYQDTNFLQRDILYLLAGNPEEANLCVVGDDDQSIYKFRGARPEIMLGFSDVYPKCKRIYMDVNYRSEPCIIQHAKTLIEHNKTRFSKDIKAFKTGEGVIQEMPAKTSEKEVDNIVKKIQQLHADKNTSYEDMAILYRNNKQAGFLSLILMRKGIPFHSNDQIGSPYKHWIFNDLMAYYRLSEGMGNGHDLIQVINKPNRFIPVQKLYKAVPEERDIAKIVYTSVSEPWKRNKAVDEVHDFFQNLRLLKSNTPTDFIQMVCSLAGYNAYLKSYAAYRNMDVTELTGMIGSYIEDIKENHISSIPEWLQYANEINVKIDNLNKSRSKKGVSISTMHKSKGLEWDTLFLLGANEGTVPSEKTVEQGNLEEERRLFYVAVTRAKRELYISYTENNEANKSRFVSEFLGQDNAKPTKDKGYKFQKGQKVQHKEYGTGTILQVSPDAIAVKFDKSAVICKFPKNKFYQLTSS